MSEEIKNVPKPEKPKYTSESIDKQLEQTKRDLLHFENQVQRMLGIINYLTQVKNSFQFPEPEKKATLEVK